jgi:hypothetical protein
MPFRDEPNTYTPTAADVGHTLKVRVIATNGAGDSSPATSAPSGVVAQTVPQNNALPRIQNATSPTVGAKLGINRGSWSPDPTSYAIQFLRCEADGTNCAAISGADQGTYTPSGADVGHTLRVRVIASNGAGDSSPATSAPTGVVAQTVPHNDNLPRIQNATNPTVGVTLGINRGSWSPQPTSYTNQFLRCDADGTNCSAIMPFRDEPNTYTPTAADVGHTLKVRVIATNSVGDSAPATSNPSGVVN